MSELFTLGGDRPKGGDFARMTELQVTQFWFAAARAAARQKTCSMKTKGASTYWACISGSVSADDPDREAKDEQAKSWLFEHVQPHLALQVDKAATSTAAWALLEKHYRIDKEANAHDLFKRVSNLRQERGESVAPYFSRAEGAFSDLAEVPGHGVMSAQVIKKAILEGIQDPRLAIAVELMSQSKDATLEDARIRLINVEADADRKDATHDGGNGTSALAAGVVWPRGGRCYESN